jgi:hypothetical protein
MNGSQNNTFLKLLKYITDFCTTVINSQLNDLIWRHAQIGFIAIRSLNISCHSHYNERQIKLNYHHGGPKQLHFVVILTNLTPAPAYILTVN